MPSIKDAVWNLDGVPDLPREKQLYILHRLQARVHELFDALVLAEEYLQANLNYDPEMEPIYKALGRKRADGGG